MSNEIRLYQGPEYAVMKHDPETVREIFAANVSTEGVNEFDLDRVNIPGTGGLAWSVPDLNGEPQPEKELVGVSILHGDRRAYWRSSFDESGGGSPPDCSSLDARSGVGYLPGDDEDGPPVERRCKTCAMSQWGSARPNKDGTPSNGQACSQRKLIFLVRQEDMIPLVVDLAPTSVRIFNRFMLRLAGRGVPCYGAIIGLRLVNEQSSTGIKYSVVSPRLMPEGVLSDPQRDRMKAFADALSPIFLKTGVETPSREEVDG